jgi:excisionase family DNA binding protein
MNQEEYISTADVAQKMQVHTRTVCRWILAGYLKATRPAGVKEWRITRADFKKFLQSGIPARKRGKHENP